MAVWLSGHGPYAPWRFGLISLAAGPMVAPLCRKKGFPRALVNCSSRTGVSLLSSWSLFAAPAQPTPGGPGFSWWAARWFPLGPFS